MNRIARSLSLLLAGLLVSVAIYGCNDGSSSNDNNDTDNTNTAGRTWGTLVWDEGEWQ